MSRPAAFTLVAVLSLLTAPIQGQQTRGGSGFDREAKRAEIGRKIEDRGIQTGQTIDDDIVLYVLDGEKITLGELLGDASTLFVTGSMTCPVAQRSCPRLDTLEELDSQVDVFVLYTLEAHPEDNEHGVYGPSGGSGASAGRSGFGSGRSRDPRGVVGSRQQPETLDERLTLAREFQQSVVGDEVQVVVDGMNDELWSALGGGPNLAVLFDAEGGVLFKQGWFDIEALKTELEKSTSGST